MADQLAAAPSLHVLPPPAEDAATPPPPTGAPLVPAVVDGDAETAYQLWAWECDQNAAEVARRLSLPERTVQRWAKDGGWRTRLDRERKELAGRTWRAVEVALIGVAPEIVKRLHGIAMGKGDTKRVRLKDGTLADVELPIPYQAQVVAANSLLDRFGLSAANAPRERPADPRGDEDTLDPAKVAAMSQEERRAILRRYDEGDR